MLPSVSVSSTSISRRALAGLTAQAILASARARVVESVFGMGATGYVLIWLLLPIFSLMITGLIYHGVRPELLAYSVVGVTASTFIFNTLYYIGQILDEERLQGTLLNLFLAPCPRLSWLLGYAIGGLVPTVLASIGAVAFGIIAFGVQFDPDIPALALSALLFLAALWGMGFVFSAAGLVLKRSNDLANLLSSFITLLGGIYYPVALLPVWLRYPARALPLGYGVQALADASLHHASIARLAPQLIPLAVFAVLLPFLGIRTFTWLERLVRQRGELELY